MPYSALAGHHHRHHHAHPWYWPAVQQWHHSHVHLPLHAAAIGAGVIVALIVVVKIVGAARSSRTEAAGYAASPQAAVEIYRGAPQATRQQFPLPQRRGGGGLKLFVLTGGVVVSLLALSQIAAFRAIVAAAGHTVPQPAPAHTVIVHAPPPHQVAPAVHHGFLTGGDLVALVAVVLVIGWLCYRTSQRQHWN